MATRVIETDEAGIAQSRISIDSTCSNLDCTCSDDLPVTITTTAEVDGHTYDDYDLDFCSLRCVSIFLDEPFPLSAAPGELPHVTIHEPDV